MGIINLNNLSHIALIKYLSEQTPNLAEIPTEDLTKLIDVLTFEVWNRYAESKNRV